VGTGPVVSNPFVVTQAASRIPVARRVASDLRRIAHILRGPFRLHQRARAARELDRDAEKLDEAYP